MQDNQNHIEKAQNYVSASNAHDIAAIGPMLAQDCRYVSTGVGEHKGKAAILAMMEGFFAGNPDVHWSVPAYHMEAPDLVAFEIAITLSGKTLEGLEKISFTDDGLITCIEVIR